MTSGWRGSVWLVAVTLALGAWVDAQGSGRAGQAPPPPPQVPQSPQIFRSAVNLVPVDVRVVDRDGRPVTDLSQADFVILENNVRQEIRHFSTTRLQAVETAPQPLLRTADTPTLGAQNRRVFLIVLGRGRLQPPAKGVDAALDLIKKHLLPQDYVGVLAWNRATDLTTDHDRIVEVVERFKKNHEKVEALLRQHFSGLAAIYGGNEIPPAIQKEIDTVFGVAGAPGVRQLPPEALANASRVASDTRRTTDALRTQAINAATDSPRLSSVADDAAAALGLDMSLDEFVEVNAQTMQDVGNLLTGIGYLRHVSGEKHLLFVSEHGLMLPRAEDDKGIAAAAADARVVLNILHTGGTNPRMGIDFRIPTSRTIADLAGGQFTSVMMGPEFVARVDGVSRFQYTLGYYPANSQMDGKYRRITVRLNRPGLRVLYRHGYFARQFQSGFDRQQMISYSRITAAASYSAAILDLPLTIEAANGKTAAGATEVNVRAQIAPHRLSLTDANGRKKGSIDVAIFCADANQRLVGVDWNTVEFEMTPDAYQRFLQKGLTYSAKVASSAPARHVKVVIYDAGADLIGSALLQVR